MTHHILIFENDFENILPNSLWSAIFQPLSFNFIEFQEKIFLKYYLNGSEYCETFE